MDTSKTYIKMCDCSLIQEQWEPKEGDWGFWKLNGDIDIIDYDDCYHKRENGIEGYIWLPRQDQIQEMMGFGIPSLKVICGYCCAEEMAKFIKSKSCTLPIGTTPEQLWLSLYIHTSHQLIWKGNKWIKEA